MTPPSPSIAGLIAELRERAAIYPVDGGPIFYDGLLMVRAADALEKQAADLADCESKLEAANLMWNEGSLREGNLLVENNRLSTDLAAAKGALEEIQTHVEYAVDVYNSSSPPVTAEMLRHANKLIEGVPKIIRDLQPKVETP